MRRTQIYIDQDLDQALRQAAAAEGRSAAALIREAVRAYLASRAKSSLGDDPILAMAGAFKGLPADAAAQHDRDLYAAPRGSRARASGA